MKRKIILASSSPARRKLLESLQLDFAVEPSAYEEVMDPALTPAELATQLALGKARDVAARLEDVVVIAADSFVVLDGEYLGKPGSAEKARQVLRRVSGRRQELVTGLAVIDTRSGIESTDHEISEIWLSELSDQEIADYIATGEPLVKAGGYSIQERGSVFVEKVSGSPTGIIGLPIHKLYRILRELDVDVF